MLVFIIIRIIITLQCFIIPEAENIVIKLHDDYLAGIALYALVYIALNDLKKVIEYYE